MGSSPAYEKETTITYINSEFQVYDFSKSKNIRAIEINCSPDFGLWYKLILLQSNYNYVDIFNKLREGKTFSINATYDTRFKDSLESKILVINSISPPKEKIITNKIIGILNIEDIYDNNLYEIVIDNFDDRLLCNDKIKKSIVVGQTYTITYIKSYGDAKYLVTNITNNDNSNITNDDDNDNSNDDDNDEPNVKLLDK